MLIYKYIYLIGVELGIESFLLLFFVWEGINLNNNCKFFCL